MLVTLDLAPSPPSVGEARRFTVATLRGWGRDDLTTTAALLVTELVTNAILHARTVVQVALERREDRVRVAVRDGSPVRPALRQHGLDATTGRGLALVAELAASWGVEMGDVGKVVWADLAEESVEQTPGQHLFLLADIDRADEPGSGITRPGPGSRHDGESRSHGTPALRQCA